eukprot:m.45433 g.45433  ORF g.45433 m.45433 type:complete len:420 (+) comp19966_c0_seq1:269-1528(+)
MHLFAQIAIVLCGMTCCVARVNSVDSASAWSIPTLIGKSDSSAPMGSHFWFPSISIPTGIAGHIAQHITLANDGGSCPAANHPQECEQIMITRDGGRTYDVVKTLAHGTSGNFNGYGDLGTWVPANKKATPPAGTFDAIVGCNDCLGKGGSVTHASFLQTWVDGAENLTLAKNVSIQFLGTPAAFLGENCSSAGCGLSSPSQTIIRTSNNNLLLSFYGFASDGKRVGTRLLYTTAFYTSSDDGLTWHYASRIDQTDAMPTNSEGPCEPSMVLIPDGRVLATFRLNGGVNLWKAYSSDNGATWTDSVEMKGCAGVGLDPVGVWPQLLLLSNGVLTLATGRPGITFWTSPTADGSCWMHNDIVTEHNTHVPADPYTATTKTTSYTGVAEVEPGIVLVAYDKIDGAEYKAYSVRINTSSLSP